MINKSHFSIIYYISSLWIVLVMSGCDNDPNSSDAVNHAPEIQELFQDSPVVTTNQYVYINAVVVDKDNDEIQYAWSCSAGRILIDSDHGRYGLASNPCRWRAPDTPGDFVVTCVVSDGMETSSKSLTITVQ